MSFTSSAMTTPSHRQSMYLAPSRPSYSRQRSNSLPAGFRSITAEDAGLMISTAERAMARRRKMVSVDTPLWMDAPVDSTSCAPEPPKAVKNTVKPTPLRQVTQVRSSQHSERPESTARALRVLDADQVNNGRSMSPSTDRLFKVLPVSPISPTKRLVTTHSLKNYADGLFQFTQNALVSNIPLLASPPQTPNPFDDVFADELVSSKTPTHIQRPSLESKFSDWSVTTGGVSDSRRSSLADPITPPIDFDTSLMSPDSFFGDFEETPRRNHFNLNAEVEISGYPSSETYEAPSALPSTPPSRTAHTEPAKDEFSYFQNFDHYLDRDSKHQQPESLEIILSPVERSLSPVTPPSVTRRRADTVIRAPVIARSCSGPAISRFAHSTPNTPFQMGDQAPTWLVGAIG